MMGLCDRGGRLRNKMGGGEEVVAAAAAGRRGVERQTVA